MDRKTNLLINERKFYSKLTLVKLLVVVLIIQALLVAPFIPKLVMLYLSRLHAALNDYYCDDVCVSRMYVYLGI